MLYSAGAGSGWPSRWSAVRTMTILQSQLTESLPTSRPVSEGQLCRRHGTESKVSCLAPEHGTLRRKYFLCGQHYSKYTKTGFLPFTSLARIQANIRSLSSRWSVQRPCFLLGTSLILISVQRLNNLSVFLVFLSVSNEMRYYFMAASGHILRSSLYQYTDHPTILHYRMIMRYKIISIKSQN